LTRHRQKGWILAARHILPHFYWFALASRTAAKKNMAVNGMLIARMTPVISPPKSGLPEASSNTEPTAAIAATQEPPKNTPLLGVNVVPPLIKRQ
jgi:hypothetical protein